MSKIRASFPMPAGDLPGGPEGDLQTYEVFIQVTRERPLAYVGCVDAADDEMAIQFAREHYGRDEPCYRVWVAPRAAFATACSDSEVIWRLSDQTYRQAKGYAGVRKKWEQFRSTEGVDSYQKDDLKEAF